MSHRDAWTEKILKDQLRAKGNKYHAKRIEIDWMVFDSKKEANRWRELVLMQQAGQITDLRRQREWPLYAAGTLDGPLEQPLLVGVYIDDFSYQRTGKTRIEDAKSPATRKIALYRLKKKIVEANYGIAIEEV